MGSTPVYPRECLSLRGTRFLCTSVNIRPFGTIKHFLNTIVDFAAVRCAGVLLSKSGFLLGGGKNVLGFFFYLCVEANK